ncbi:hypothetical protein GGR54DRAFT_640404 [Hypoxylon sp. NC1633]|nr:hypothetical protein GGR54DRAFT_640404 [Hypoxylon sp. NC1633]
MGRLAPVDPRGYLPSRAHPEHRSARKELEKEHPFGWTEPLLLGMLGVGLVWNIEKQVQKHEERKDREEQQGKEREERRRRKREQQIRNGTFDPSGRNKSRDNERDGGSSRASASDRGAARDTVDLEKGRRSRRDRVQSVDMGPRDDPRYIEEGRYYEQSRYDRRHDDRYDDRYDDRHDGDRYDDDRRVRDRAPSTRRGRSRRDSW